MQTTECVDVQKQQEVPDCRMVEREVEIMDCQKLPKEICDTRTQEVCTAERVNMGTLI